MRPEYVENEKEKKDKKRGAFYSFTAHILILLLAFWPMLDKESDVEHFPKPIVIQFAGGAGNEGASPSKAGEESADDGPEAMESSEAVAEAIEAVSEPVAEAVPEPVVTPQEVRPVRTSPNMESIKMPDKPTIDSKSKTPIKIDKSTLPKPVPADMDILAPRPGGSNTNDSNTSGAGSSNTASKGSQGTGSSDGKDGKGQGNTGTGTDKSGSGNSGSGGIFEGIGDLKRAVVHRPNLKVLVKEEGVIAFDVCVTREGKVTQVVFDRKNSTIKDKESIQKTLDVANQFRFEQSLSGPALECGKMRIRIRMDL